MEWQAFGFKENPLKTTPIKESTLSLFTGHEAEVKVCSNVLSGGNQRMVIEGARGVGTTSFANYIRFNAVAKKDYFTPRGEIKVEAGWRLETLLAAIISNLVRELELLARNEKIISDKRFAAAKALSSRIAETYRSFGVDAFGFGGSVGKSAGPVTQPIMVPSTTLGHHIEDLISLVQERGYKKGILLQLNNLDVGEIHQEEDLKYLFNALRDYTQTEGSSWIFVGDLGLRKFIAQQVDRLDDIISYEVKLNPISNKDLATVLDKRVAFYGNNKKAELPVDKNVFNYLYKITNGRLRYVFGLISRLLNRLYVGDLTDKVTLDIAKPMLIKLGRDRVENRDITASEEALLKQLVQTPNETASVVAKKMDKSVQYAGRLLMSLSTKSLVTSKKKGRERTYMPSMDAVIAYTELKE